MLTIDKDFSLGIADESVKFPMSKICFKDLFRYILTYTDDNYKDIDRVSPIFRIFYSVNKNKNLEVLHNIKTKEFIFSFSEFKDWKSIRSVGKITIYDKVILTKEQVLDLFKT